MNTVHRWSPVRVPEPPIAQVLFADTRSAGLWLLLRGYAGWAWLTAGLGKWGEPVWTGPQAGAAVAGFARSALTKTAGEHPDVTAGYAWFLQNVVIPNAAFFSWLVTLGEILVGLALLLGAFTGIAAFLGGFMNANFLLAGTVSSNPILFIIATWLVLAWRVAGWYGLDRYLLPRVGTPWEPGAWFEREPSG